MSMSTLQAKSTFIFHSKVGFPLSCKFIYNTPGYEVLKSVVKEDLNATAFSAIELCEKQTGQECIEVNTYTEALKADAETCFTVSVAREL